jgi:hypothetical protein
MLNLFVPVPGLTLVPAAHGLWFEPGGEIRREFAARFAAERGTILAGYRKNRCLCGFDDWTALYDLARELMAQHSVEAVALLLFFSGTRGPLPERIVDPEDQELCTAGLLDELIIVRREPAAQRNYRKVMRSLARRIGEPVVVRLKSGRALHGALVAFDTESEVGSVDDQVFVAGQVLAVEPVGASARGKDAS